ncbi:MAG: FecR family protein [Candidatus Riflebacteria bacterium]|nr:FecR family protein [Candidatus Riflebacteria bacterium]
MNRTALCFLFICCLFSLSAAWAEPVQLVPLDAKLEIVSGQIKLTRVGSTKTDIITQGCELFSGDLLETLRESKAVLVYGDGTNMRIKERTLVEVQPMSIKVFKGKTWYKFTKRGTEFRIETPTLVAGIRGTEFEVAVSSRKKASVSVVEGAVAVSSIARGRRAVLRPGMATHCEPGGQLVAPYNFNIDKKKAEWANADWQKAAAAPEDVNRLFIKYLNFKNEYGVDDPRTVEAKQALENAKKNKK